ncbi:hypothetical protein Cgig2_008840 [Carnegiea gigantea]|uniref:Uncharacterized protein n=1 Tax=Carnegiea gigantea TaxID=171969 RepID=A0A9Q1GM87_9CARY|nr:hypothetical protein Cgig2_008840 [Carnegiea gigantea]
MKIRLDRRKKVHGLLNPALRTDIASGQRKVNVLLNSHDLVVTRRRGTKGTVGFRDVDGNNGSLWENMEVEIANPIEIQEGDDEEIPLVKDDVEPHIVDADIVDANLVDANFIQDDNDENDKDVVSEDDEDDFSDMESDIDSFDRELEEDESDDDSARKRGPTRGLKSLREKEQNPNVKPFAKITPDMEHVIVKLLHYPDQASGSAQNKWDWLVNHWADPKQQHISEKNWANRLRQKIKPANGAKHKDGSWDLVAAAKYEEFKELHMSQIEKEGANNLSLKEAYLLVMKEKSGYHRGLRPNPQPPRKGRATEVMRVEVAAEI